MTQNLTKQEPWEVEAERETQYMANLYSRGEQINAAYQRIHPQDYNTKEAFHQEYLSRPFDEKAIQYYSETRNQPKDRQKDQPNPLPKTGQKTEPLNTKASSMRLNEAIDKFIADNQEGVKPWGTSQFEKYTAFLRFFSQRMENCHLHELTHDNIKKKYVNIQTKWPVQVHQKKIFKDENGVLLGTDEIIRITQEHKLPTQGTTTIKQKTSMVKSFLNYCLEEGWMDNELILKAFKDISKLDDDSKKRLPFSPEHLRMIFGKEEFKTGEWFRNPKKQYHYRFWAPLIALYTGARANEICQLNTKDVVEDEQTGVWYFNFVNEDDDLSVKTLASRRKVPVHQNLVDLGLLDYRDHRIKMKEKKLLGGVSHSEKTGWKRNLINWFNGPLFGYWLSLKI